MSASKILALSNLRKAIEAEKAEGNTVALCHGVFDLFHVGHLRHLQAAKRFADILVVSLTDDQYVNKGPGRPVFNAELRAELLASLGIVDYVTVCSHASAEPAIEAVRPTSYVKGSDYADSSKDITGKIARERELVERHGGQVVFTNEMVFSSSNLLNQHFNVFDENLKIYLSEIRAMGGEGRFNELLEKIAGLNVLIIGETIIDEYKYVSPMGKSAKENIIATLWQSDEMFAGGAIAAANHLATICPNIEVVTMLGDPAVGENHESFVREHCHPSITLTPVYRANGPTVQKTRFVEPTYVRKLFEVYRMDDAPLSDDVEERLLRIVGERLEKADVVIVCDFGHGFISEQMVRLLQEKARFLSVNAQSNSANIGYNLITKYNRADYICIDAPEAWLAAHNKHIGLATVVGETLPELIDCPRIVVTHGKSGCYTFDRDTGRTTHIPAFRHSVVDTVGAGDAFFVVTAPFVAVGAEAAFAGFVGNVAGAIKVNIVGHRQSVSKLQIQRYVGTLLK